MSADDATLPSAHPRLRVGQLREQVGSEWADVLLKELGATDGMRSAADCKRLLTRLVSEYQPR